MLSIAIILGFKIFYDQKELLKGLKKLQMAYPDFIQSVSTQNIIWMDGMQMTVGEKINNTTLAAQVLQDSYSAGKLIKSPTRDPGRIRYGPFFKKMYGNNPPEVEKNLVIIYWLPKLFGQHYPLKVTRVNGVDQKLIQISSELENLPAIYHKYVENPAGTYQWRNIAGTNQLSLHSFGAAIDINTECAHYWRWDLNRADLHHIPWEIVAIFEKHGFIWGGKWDHYDTMHFEYRPEMLEVAP